MSDLRLPKEATLIASSAADQFARLEAMFDAIRIHLTAGMYEHSLAEVGQAIACQYEAGMRGLAKSEGRHGESAI